MYHYPGFRVGRDAKKLSKELKHNLTRFTAWEAVCRVRCSKGFRVSSFNGHFFIRSMDLLALPAANADQAYAVQIAHDEVLPTTNTSYLQCALLYTNAEGERRIRVHTMMVLDEAAAAAHGARERVGDRLLRQDMGRALLRERRLRRRRVRHHRPEDATR